MIALTTVISGLLLTSQLANATTTEEDSALTTQLSEATAVTGDANITCYPGWIQGDMRPMGPGRHGGPDGGFNGWGQGGYIEVSEEFEENVMTIANNDSDVQQLLNDGYNATGVIRPIIKTVVDADGNVVTKATSAVVVLQKDTEGAAGVASVLVDVENSKVTQIVILTRTVIDKS